MDPESQPPKDLGDIISILRKFIELSIEKGERDWTRWVVSTASRTPTRCWERMGCNERNCPAYENECPRCWLIAGTMCGGEIQGHYAQKYHTCTRCEYFREAVFTEPLAELQEHILILVHNLRAKQQELNEAREKAVEEKRKTSAVIAALGDGISIQDRDFRIIYQNRIAREMIGDHRGEYCFLAYEKSEEVCADCPVAKCFQDGEVHSAERCVGKEPNQRYVEITASPLRDAGGKIIAGIEIVREITYRKQMEKALLEEKNKLQAALSEVKTLRGLLPICASCKRIRDDKGLWNQIESYIRDRSEAEFTHGLCPECAAKLYPGLDLFRDRKDGED